MESLIYYIIAFIVGVLTTRWVFCIDKIIASLKKQNELGTIQVRLLKKMLIDQGAASWDIDEIIRSGNTEKK